MNNPVKVVRYDIVQSDWLPDGCGFYISTFHSVQQLGGVAQMVERSLSMREVPGSIPGASKCNLFSRGMGMIVNFYLPKINNLLRVHGSKFIFQYLLKICLPI